MMTSIKEEENNTLNSFKYPQRPTMSFQMKCCTKITPCEDSDIPVFRLSALQAEDPVAFIDSIYETGMKYGAVKLIPPHSPSHIDGGSMWVRTRRQILNVHQEHDGKRRKISDDRGKVVAGCDAMLRRSRDTLISKGFYAKFDEVTDLKKHITVNDSNTFPGYDFHHWMNTDVLSVSDCEGKGWKKLSDFDMDTPETSAQDAEKSYWENDQETKIECGIDNLSATTNFPDKSMRNLPICNSSMLRWLKGNHKSISQPTISVMPKFTTLNWRCGDHGLNLINRSLVGTRVWYFSQKEGLSPHLPQRFDHKNEKFNALYSKSHKQTSSVFVSPDYLRSKGKTVYKTYQYPGEWIVTFPQSCSAHVSLDLGVSESVYVAPKNWLKIAVEEQPLFPEFSPLELFLDISLRGEPDLLKLVERGLCQELNQHLQMRRKVRESVPGIKEVKTQSSSLTDVDLVDAFPSKVVLLDSGYSFSVSLERFLLADFSDYSVELHMHYSDEKLRWFMRQLKLRNQTEDDWLERYNQVLQSYRPSLKSFHKIFLEGERIFKNGDKFKHLEEFENCGKFISSSNDWIEKAQGFLSSKHQLKMRKKGMSDSTGIAELCRLLDEIDRLAFYAPEMDQLLDFAREIQNFESGVRMVLNSTSIDVEELSNLVSLGKSFAIKLESVEFLDRMLGRIQVLEQMEKCDLDLEVAQMEHLRKESLRLFAKCDLAQYRHFCSLLEESGKLTHELTLFLKQESFPIEEVESWIQKSSQIPLSKAIRLELMDIRDAHITVVEQAEKIYEEAAKHKSTKKYNTVINLFQTAKELRTVPDISKLNELTRVVDTWMAQVGLYIHSDTTLKASLQHLINMVDIAFSIDKKDRYATNRSSNNKYFCFCRHMEGGTMIECDVCNEWYHLQCLGLEDDTVLEDRFICPMCDLKGVKQTTQLYFHHHNQRPELSGLCSLYEQGMAMPLACEEMKFVKEAIDDCFAFLHKNMMKSLATCDGKIVEQDVKKARFYLRKLIGCPLRCFPDQIEELRLIHINHTLRWLEQTVAIEEAAFEQNALEIKPEMRVTSDSVILQSEPSTIMHNQNSIEMQKTVRDKDATESKIAQDGDATKDIEALKSMQKVDATRDIEGSNSVNATQELEVSKTILNNNSVQELVPPFSGQTILSNEPDDNETTLEEIS